MDDRDDQGEVGIQKRLLALRFSVALRARRICIAAILHTDNVNHFEMVREISKVQPPAASRTGVLSGTAPLCVYRLLIVRVQI
jgi:hypothetical protein